MIRGEPGVGKTTLVEYVVRSADDLQVVYLDRDRSERELGYAALHRLLTPILKRIDKLPEPQRVAMKAAFGLGPRASTDRFMIGLATVTLAAESGGLPPAVVRDRRRAMGRPSIDRRAGVSGDDGCRPTVRAAVRRTVHSRCAQSARRVPVLVAPRSGRGRRVRAARLRTPSADSIGTLPGGSWPRRQEIRSR